MQRMGGLGRAVVFRVPSNRLHIWQYHVDQLYGVDERVGRDQDGIARLFAILGMHQFPGERYRRVASQRDSHGGVHQCGGLQRHLRCVEFDAAGGGDKYRWVVDMRSCIWVTALQPGKYQGELTLGGAQRVTSSSLAKQVRNEPICNRVLQLMT